MRSGSLGQHARPLVVDLDGTLISTDLLHESASGMLLHAPWRLPAAWSAARKGRAALKACLAGAAPPNAASLPYHPEVLAFVRDERAKGRNVVLATASHSSLAQSVAEHLGCFDYVMASSADYNLRAAAKRDALIAQFGERGFDYVGNSQDDLAVWEAAHTAHVVGGPALVQGAAQRASHIGQHFAPSKAGLKVWGKALRPHQWLKNLLVMLPMLAAHQYWQLGTLLQGLLAMLAFSLAASSVYLLNDLVDVDSDRQHRSKCRRPFAAGTLPLLHGWLAWPALLATAFTLAATLLPWRFALVLSGYYLLTLAYSLHLKRRPMVDVLALAALYTTRVVAGAVATAIPLSFWMLAFCMFLFLSLAFIKRYSELADARAHGKIGTVSGRGYRADDLEIIASLGPAAGYLSVLVLALYVQDPAIAQLYAQPKLIWLACPAMLYWMSRIWLLAHRGQVDDDPVVFAIKDRHAWVVLAIIAAAFVSARGL